MIKLVCPECRRENEPERIYCHDCGARLDRSSLAKTGPKEEDPAVTHRRVKALFDARGALVRKAFFNGSKFILGALLFAAVIQIIRPPDLPEEPKEKMLSRQIGIDLETAASDPRVAPIRYSAAEVNAYIDSGLRSKRAALSKWLNFERAVVGFDEGKGRITVQRSVFGLSVYTSGIYGFSLPNGALAVDCKGGALGRLPVHPALMRSVGSFLFGDFLGAFDRERKSIVKLGSIEFQPDTVILSPKQR